jgi:hypothetical protein
MLWWTGSLIPANQPAITKCLKMEQLKTAMKPKDGEFFVTIYFQYLKVVKYNLKPCLYAVDISKL